MRFPWRPSNPSADGVPGRRAVAAFQATWEHVYGRPMVIGPPQYADPILLDTAAYRWQPVDGAPGAAEKRCGTFTDCDMRAARYNLEPGAALRASGRGLFLVLEGRGSLADRPYRALTGLYLADGESATFHADERSDILLLGLPALARMQRPLDGVPGGEDNAARSLSVAGTPRS
mgnify:CR=1 FL=1